jgi:Universal stress protein family
MGQLKRIVVGHDLKSGGETALKSAVVLAGRCNAAFRLVHVVEPHHLYQMISHPMASKNNLEETVQQTGRKLREIVGSWELAHTK